tara:strand:+ start:155 stop:355 length:201 start_codon:yes stop_codon:yes gene_type:complete
MELELGVGSWLRDRRAGGDSYLVTEAHDGNKFSVRSLRLGSVRVVARALLELVCVNCQQPASVSWL